MLAQFAWERGRQSLQNVAGLEFDGDRHSQRRFDVIIMRLFCLIAFCCTGAYKNRVLSCTAVGSRTKLPHSEQIIPPQCNIQHHCSSAPLGAPQSMHVTVTFSYWRLCHIVSSFSAVASMCTHCATLQGLPGSCWLWVNGHNLSHASAPCMQLSTHPEALAGLGHLEAQKSPLNGAGVLQ